VVNVVNQSHDEMRTAGAALYSDHAWAARHRIRISIPGRNKRFCIFKAARGVSRPSEVSCPIGTGVCHPATTSTRA
jgi:hypothetical protein